MAEEKKKSSKGKFFLGAALGAVAGIFAGRAIAKKAKENSCNCDEDCKCGDECTCGDDCKCEKDAEKKTEKKSTKKAA